jgi:MFS family permease
MIELSAPTYCANHPKVETTLRCNNCGKFICAKCAVRTPTGYRCRECVRGQQKVFVTAVWYDYLLGFFMAGILSFCASLLAALISTIAGFFGWILIIIATPTAGVIIAEAVRFTTRKHRARALFITVAAGVVLGALPAILINLFVFHNVFGAIFQGVFLFIAAPIVYARLSGIQMTR